jgi:hypothetical protein
MRFSPVTEALPLSDVGGAWVFPSQGVLYTETTCETPHVEHVEALFDRFVHTVPIELVGDPEPALRERGVLQPDPSLHARLRLAWRRHRGVREGDRRCGSVPRRPAAMAPACP